MKIFSRFTNNWPDTNVLLITNPKTRSMKRTFRLLIVFYGMVVLITVLSHKKDKNIKHNAAINKNYNNATMSAYTYR